MLYSIPIRLSARLASQAREVASVSDRSLTEQVEHWARLGQIVEAQVSSGTVTRLKALSYDERLPALIAEANTPAAQRRTTAAVRARAKGPIYGVAKDDPNVVVRHNANGTVTRGSFVRGVFVEKRSRKKQR